jgi:acyl dehydratase
VPIDYRKIKSWRFEEVVHTYGIRDTLLYALGVGVGFDPLDSDQLRYTYEDALSALPSMAVVLGYNGFWLNDPDTGLDWKAVLHMSDEIELFAPIKPEGTVVGRMMVEEIYDKGAGRGAILQTRRDILDEAGNLIGRVRQLEYCRGEGGFLGPEAPRPVRRQLPDRAPDAIYEMPTQPNQALIYRLSGDMNPLHVDPRVAKDVGFDRPILHGRSTLGASSYAALRFSGRRAEDVQCMKLNFTAPVFPGDTLAVRLWKNDGKIVFSASALERDVLVADEGAMEFR